MDEGEDPFLTGEAVREGGLQAGGDGREGKARLDPAGEAEEAVERRRMGNRVVVPPPEGEGAVPVPGPAQGPIQGRPVDRLMKGRPVGGRPGGPQAFGDGNALPRPVEGHGMRGRGRVRQFLPDRRRKASRRQIGLGQDRGEAERLQALGAQALLGLLTRLEGHEHRPRAGAQEIHGRVVARLADRHLGP
jgi:hypothetical protein